MTFRPDALRPPAGGTGSGQVDYRLARNSVVAEFGRGRLSRLDVCDAHPELIRAARNVGAPADQDCPICAEPGLVHVTYVFGSRLPPHGRCISSLAELAGYVVEVCPECSWNHLLRMFPVGGRRAT